MYVRVECARTTGQSFSRNRRELHNIYHTPRVSCQQERGKERQRETEGEREAEH